MNTLWKYITYGYLVLAVVMLIEAFSQWSENPSKAYLLIGFSVLLVVVFFIKKRLRERIENRQNNQK